MCLLVCLLSCVPHSFDNATSKIFYCGVVQRVEQSSAELYAVELRYDDGTWVHGLILFGPGAFHWELDTTERGTLARACCIHGKQNSGEDFIFSIPARGTATRLERGDCARFVSAEEREEQGWQIVAELQILSMSMSAYSFFSSQCCNPEKICPKVGLAGEVYVHVPQLYNKGPRIGDLISLDTQLVTGGLKCKCAGLCLGYAIPLRMDILSGGGADTLQASEIFDFEAAQTLSMQWCLKGHGASKKSLQFLGYDGKALIYTGAESEGLVCATTALNIDADPMRFVHIENAAHLRELFGAEAMANLQRILPSLQFCEGLQESGFLATLRENAGASSFISMLYSLALGDVRECESLREIGPQLLLASSIVAALTSLRDGFERDNPHPLSDGGLAKVKAEYVQRAKSLAEFLSRFPQHFHHANVEPAAFKKIVQDRVAIELPKFEPKLRSASQEQKAAALQDDEDDAEQPRPRTRKDPKTKQAAASPSGKEAGEPPAVAAKRRRRTALLPDAASDAAPAPARNRRDARGDPPPPAPKNNLRNGADTSKPLVAKDLEAALQPLANLPDALVSGFERMCTPLANAYKESHKSPDCAASSTSEMSSQLSSLSSSMESALSRLQELPSEQTRIEAAVHAATAPLQQQIADLRQSHSELQSLYVQQCEATASERARAMAMEKFADKESDRHQQLWLAFLAGQKIDVRPLQGSGPS